MDRTVISTLLAGVLLAACSDATSPPEFRTTSPDPLAVSVMSRNAYVGADVDAVIAALGTEDPTDDFDALMLAIGTIVNTDFPARAQAFADEIVAARPHVVGIAEISLIDIDLTPLGMNIDFTLDFLPILQAALAQRGLDYAVGAKVKNIDVSVAGGLVQLVDYDVVLYDAEHVQWQTVWADHFTNNIPPDMLPPGLVLKRSWIWGRATIGPNTIHIVSTHPESGGDGIPEHPLSQLRAGQAFEIVAALEGVSPVVLMGDLNDQPGSPLYQVFSGAAFTDVWTALRPGEVGNTCCHEYDLSNATANFTKRIDYVFARGMRHPGGDYPKSFIALVGDDPADRVTGPAYPIWPSDHGGLVAEFFVPPAIGTR
ncbi:MAG: endonuclease/exonuclease/phosphatase family protein [Gemmatimonadota bacterium]|nr:endonuclease/exonuclease/phosphatase family protein [Gemmatimonadota bacterium]MDH5198601.1 endonuclease/exonuclease/phosphatase family protein [Gemmatimonadota bacterium]